jgi:4-hydroxy-4-methyl-2-oxoglutarate aldolase
VIDDPPLLTVAASINRSAAALVDAFKGVSTCFISDAMNGAGAMDWRIKPLGPIKSFAGLALTSSSGPADNLGFCAAIQKSEPGDVLVAATDQFTGTALTGDLLLGIARNRGVAALVTDGLVRDQADLESLGLPYFAMGASLATPAKNGPGTAGLPIICGGVRVCSGDIIVGDRDGVVVVPRREAPQVLKTLVHVKEEEASLLKKVQGGLSELSFIADMPSHLVRIVDAPRD